MTELKTVPRSGHHGDASDGYYDPVTQPRLFDRVIRKRVGAFIVDAIIIVSLTAVGGGVGKVVGVVTIGLAWFLFPLVFPVVALGYNAITIGGPKSATIGMRSMGLEVRLWNGGKVLPLIAAFHALLFWVSLYSLVLWIPNVLWPLFDAHKRCLHDLLARVVVLNRS